MNQLSIDSFNEWRYFSFALLAGLRNLAHNGVRLGLKKTVGKIAQPINAHTRFPEYYLFEKYLQPVLAKPGARILDIGSPKMFGFYLASTYPVQVHLTDIHRKNINEYEIMWRVLQSRAAGHAVFSVRDGRSIREDDSSFDAVFSMSVLEHVEGQGQDHRTLREISRCLAPQGILCLSVPFGRRFVIQQNRGRLYDVSDASSSPGPLTFFQRIYSSSVFQEQVRQYAEDLYAEIQCIYVGRRDCRLTRWYSRWCNRCPESIQGLLGWLNPLLSKSINVISVSQSIYESYQEIRRRGDVYGDIIMTARRR